VLNPGAEVVKRIRLAGDRPTNLCFGPDGSKKIYVTEQGIGNLEVHDVDCDGWPLLGGPG
jgi:sugar lactone lactonase YvrE